MALFQKLLPQLDDDDYKVLYSVRDPKGKAGHTLTSVTQNRRDLESMKDFMEPADGK